jgi:hypothetical protein
MNAVYPEHPTKKEYYTKQAAKRGIPAPKYAATGKNQKLVSFCSIFLINNYNFLTSIN